MLNPYNIINEIHLSMNLVEITGVFRHVVRGKDCRKYSVLYSRPGGSKLKLYERRGVFAHGDEMSALQKRVLTYTSYLYLLGYAFTVTNIGPCNGPISSHFGFGESTMGLLISTHFTGFIISVMYAGYLVDRVGLKPVMITAAITLGVTMYIMGRSFSVNMLFVMMFLTGLGGGAVEAAVNTMIANLHKDARVFELNKLHVFFGVGAFVWPTVAGMYLGGGGSWRVLYYVIGIFSTVVALTLLFQKFPEHEKTTPVRPSDMVAMLKNPRVVALCGVIAFYVGGEMGINAWVVRYFDEVLHASEALAEAARNKDSIVAGMNLNSNFFLTMYWFSITVGRVVATVAGKYIPDIKLLRIMAVISTICATITFSVNSYALAAVFLAATGLFFSGIFATTIAAGSNMFPSRTGIVSGIIIGFSGIGNIIFSAGIGWIAELSGLRAGLLFAAAMLGVMTICSFLIKQQGETVEI